MTRGMEKGSGKREEGRCLRRPGGGDPLLDLLDGDWESGWKRGRGRVCVGEAGIGAAMPSLRSWLAAPIPASQARRPFGANLMEFCFESLLRQ